MVWSLSYKCGVEWYEKVGLWWVPMEVYSFVGDVRGVVQCGWFVVECLSVVSFVVECFFVVSFVVVGFI